MARDENRRQKALAKKKKKDKERANKSRLSNIFDFDSASKMGIIRNAKKLPIYECVINSDWQSMGMPHILISRKQPDNTVVIGYFIVDILCLGVKGSFCNANITIESYEGLKARSYQNESIITCHPKLANRIIYGAIEYARKLGFEPDKDFALSRYVLDERSDVDLSFPVEFGRDGKPMYISGPRDNVDHILNKLTKKVGVGNFDYTLRIDDTSIEDEDTD